MPSSLINDSGEGLSEQIKHLSLGSRKGLCINTKVARLGSATTINERCLELQQSGIGYGDFAGFRRLIPIGTSEEKRCEFLPKKDDQVIVRDFRDHTLATIRDIEDLSKLGKKMGTCPYYASRSAIKPSEVRIDVYCLPKILTDR